MNCTCKCWEYKQITIKCHKCDGLLSYVRTETVNKDDEKQIILKKLKDELITKQADVMILKQEIRDLELELKGD
jgi:hypothetical protein